MSESDPASDPDDAKSSAVARDSRASSKGAVEKIVVTARRRMEWLQDVPISITVYNQRQLDDLNIVNASDLAVYTPSLTANRRIGDDNTSFAIRGFMQELRTSPTVGVYFADVIAPRGGASVTSGEGTGPGSFFDLENVQVLKGPQGTLFGRNTTGGAILLVPRKPTNEWEGYFASSIGNFDMLRFQGVANAPLHDMLRLRIGFDRQTRDGYLDNTSGIGPNDLSDVGYTALRASMVMDLWEPLENYTIFSYLDSENHGPVHQVFKCNTNVPTESPFADLFGPLCGEQLATQGGDFYEVRSGVPNPKSVIHQWQLINTTTLAATDSLTIKNIISTSDLETTLQSAVFGTDFQVPTETGTVPLYFSTFGQIPGIPTNSQDSFVEELQFQGSLFDEIVEWQGGVYYERSKPDGLSGFQSANILSCDLSTLGSNPDDFRCNNITGLPFGAVSKSLGTIKFENTAVYAQANVDVVPDLLGLTGGVRYTWDKTWGTSTQTAYTFDQQLEGGYVPPNDVKCVNGALPDCTIHLKQDSDAPTWLVSLDLHPTEQVLAYAKYARGYRQGSVNIFGVEGLNKFGPEKVDTYELGSKTSFAWPFPGNFNVAGFYNDFRDQQIQFGILATSLVPTTAIVNAGRSRIWGVEAEANVEPLDGVRLSGAYTYLNTKLTDLDAPTLPPSVLAAIPTATEGDPLPFTPEHELSFTASYLLPFVPGNAGDVTLSATYVYTSDQQAVTPSASPFHTIPSYDLLNFNINWDRIMDWPLHASFFMTNSLEEHYWTYLNGTYNTTGFESRVLAQPRMFGARVRYDFRLGSG